MKDIQKQLVKELNLKEDEGCIIFQVFHANPCSGDYPKIFVALADESVAVCKNSAPIRDGIRLVVRDYGDKLSSLGCPIVTELHEKWAAIGRINITEMINGQEITTEIILGLFAELTKEKPICNINIFICGTGLAATSIEQHADKSISVKRWEYAPCASEEDIDALTKKGTHFIWPTDVYKDQGYVRIIFGEGMQLYTTSRDKIPTALMQLDSQTLNATDGEG